MPAEHRPYVQPFNDATTRYIARCDCGCGLYEDEGTQEAAQAVVDAAAEVNSDAQ